MSDLMTAARAGAKPPGSTVWDKKGRRWDHTLSGWVCGIGTIRAFTLDSLPPAYAPYTTGPEPERPARPDPTLRIIALEQAVKSMEGRNFSHPGGSAVSIAEIMLKFLEEGSNE